MHFYDNVSQILLREKNVSNKIFIENQNAYFIFGKYNEIRAVGEIMWKNMVETDRLQMKI
jgi:hypothetical protein